MKEEGDSFKNEIQTVVLIVKLIDFVNECDNDLCGQ
jgi:hypothetical protein